jgi:hypothetical protein
MKSPNFLKQCRVKKRPCLSHIISSRSEKKFISKREVRATILITV